MEKEGQLVHGTAFSLDGIGVLLRGPSGSGKSDFAFRCLSLFGSERTFFISDDQVTLTPEQGRILMRPPLLLQGLLEVRGIGILEKRPFSCGFLSIIVALTPEKQIERLPKAPWSQESVLGVSVPVASLDPFLCSACFKLELLSKLLRKRCPMPLGGA